MTCRRSQVRVLYRPPKQKPLTKVRGSFLCLPPTHVGGLWTGQDSKARHRRRRGKKQSGGLFFSAWLVESRNVYRDVCCSMVDGTGLEQGGSPPASSPSPSLLRNATSPKVGGFGRPVLALLDEGSFLTPESAGLRCFGQQQLIESERPSAFRQIVAYIRTREVGTHIRRKTAKVSYIRGMILMENMV